MKNKKRETIAKAYSITTAIKKKLAEVEKEKPRINLSNLAIKLADRRDSVVK